MTLRADLMRQEGLRLTPYKDNVKGVLTIGYGRSLEMGISASEAAMLLDNDIAAVTAELDHALPWWRGRPQWVQDGMANCCFQMGLAGLLTFRVGLSCLQAGDYQGAQAAFRDSLWAKQTPTRAQEVIQLFSAEPQGIGGTDDGPNT